MGLFSGRSNKLADTLVSAVEPMQENVVSKLLLTVVTGTLLSMALTGCDLEILPMPAGVLRTYECVECYDTVVEEWYVEEPVVVFDEPAYVVDTYYVDEPVYVEETYTEEVWVDEPVYEEYYVEEEYSEEGYVESDYVAGY